MLAKTIFLAFVAVAAALPLHHGSALVSRQDFLRGNGQTAQDQNNKFKSLSANSPCTDGENACIDGKFAQCAFGKFVITPCAAGTTCAALPLLLKSGTSVTCTTPADRDQRISSALGSSGGSGNTGNSGSGNNGSGNGNNNTGNGNSGSVNGNPADDEECECEDDDTETPQAPSPQNPAPSSGGNIRVENGRKAQSENEQFKSLTPNSPCGEGQNACINGAFAQCVFGKFVLTQCGPTLTCASLPLVNSPGTSLACTTPADRDSRIQIALSS